MHIDRESKNPRNLGVPFPRSYWVIPGLLLAGEYPGAKEQKEAEQKLSGLLDAGIRQLINLMEPDETDHDGQPFNLYENILAPLVRERTDKAEVIKLPIRDLNVPNNGKMTEILDATDAAIEKRIPVYMHCWGGVGRTGTVIGCFLIRHGLANSENVIEKIAQLRANEEKFYRKSPETPEQREFVRNWHLQESDGLSRLNRYIGCMLGGGVGDALGAPVEFMTTGSIRRTYGGAGIADYDQVFGRIGAITDDTQMALFTAEGLLRTWSRGSTKGICHPPSVVNKAYKRWLDTQNSRAEECQNEWDESFLMRVPELFSRRAPGNSCLSALRQGKMGTMEEPINSSKGCGGVMRMAPVGLLLNAPEEAFKLGCELAALTHGHPSGYLAAGVLAAMISKIKTGDSIRDAVCEASTILKRYPGYEECLDAIDQALKLTDETPPTPESVESLGEGWVAEEALAISIYCALWAEDDFSAGVRTAVNHSGDSDSTGAITGNILGCMLGASAIPAKWVDDLELSELIQEMAVDLFIRFRNDDAWWARYPGY